MRPEFKQSGGGDDFADQDGVIRQLFEGRQWFRLQVVKQPPDYVFEIAAALAQIFIVEAIVRLKEVVTDLLNRPLGIDALGLYFFDDAINEQAVLKHQQMRINE